MHSRDILFNEGSPTSASVPVVEDHMPLAVVDIIHQRSRCGLHNPLAIRIVSVGRRSAVDRNNPVFSIVAVAVSAVVEKIPTGIVTETINPIAVAVEGQLRLRSNAR